MSMPLFITSLNSGSNGNCYYIGNNDEAVLIDAGISCKETEKRMAALGLTMDKVRAVFISHEHTDHISGLQTLAKKYNLPVYITQKTLKRCHLRLQLNKSQIQTFTAQQTIMCGALSVYAFPKFHDADDPHSFTITYNNVTVGVFTDIGNVCNNLVENFKKCHAVFLESNYCEEMLANGGYPYFLKKRISGGNGHLSNREALQLFTEHRPQFLSHLILSHLSNNNNNPQLVYDMFHKNANDTNIIVASRHTHTPVYTITAGKIIQQPKAIHLVQLKPQQLALF